MLNLFCSPLRARWERHHALRANLVEVEFPIPQRASVQRKAWVSEMVPDMASLKINHARHVRVFNFVQILFQNSLDRMNRILHKIKGKT